MRLSYKHLLIGFLLIFPISNAINVGISPGYLDLGELEPGDSKIVRFYLVTSSDDLFIVSLGSSKGSIDFFQKEGYEDHLQFYSEEDVSSWVSFINNPIELLPPNETLEKTKGGAVIKGMREVVFILNVPEDAEPGYHVGMITTNPKLPSTGGGSVSIIATVPLEFIFKVKGNAVRDGEIFDVVNKGDRMGELWLEIFFKNNGTVTESVRDGLVELYNNNELVGSAKISTAIVRPDEVEELAAFLDYSYLKEGTYHAKAEVSFITGTATWEGDVKVGEKKEIPTGKVTQEKEKRTIPWRIILLLVIILIAYIIYRS